MIGLRAFILGLKGIVVSMATAFPVLGADIQSAIDLCVLKHHDFEAFSATAQRQGLTALEGDAARSAYEMAADMVFVYRAASAMKAKDPTVQDLVRQRAEIVNAISNHSLQDDKLGLSAIFELPENGVLIARGTPTYGVSTCTLYTIRDLPAAATATLGPRTLLTKSHAPWIVTQEIPLSKRSNAGHVEAVHTPDAELFETQLGVSLSIRHVVKISTPSKGS